MITILISIFKSRTWSVLLATLLVVTACGAGTTGSDRIKVVTTTSIWGDVVAEIVGDDADLEVLIPPNLDAHDYQPTSQQAASLLEADLVVANGLGLEEGLADVLESATDDGANVLEVALHLDPLPFASHDHDHEDEDHEDHEDEDHEDHEDDVHQHGDLDPHVWFDPQRVARAAELIAEELSAVDSSIDWMSRARAYTDELNATDDEMQRLLSEVPQDRRKLVTNHEALGYLAARYDFEVVGVVIPGGSTLSDPSSAELAELVHIIEDEGVDVIFTETSQPSRLAEAVAAEVGRDISIVALHTESLDDPGTPAGTLAGFLTEDARLISEALG